MEILRASRVRYASGWIVLFLAAIPAESLHAQKSSSAREIVGRDAVYSAFVLNLARFIHWPEDAFAKADAPFVIGTFAREPINDVLDRYIQGESVNKHPVRTLRIRSPSDLLTCHVVFISQAEVKQAGPALAQIHGHAILAISDADGFLELGGHVQLVPVGQSIHLRIDLPQLEASGLSASAQLLRLAEVKR